MLYYIFNHIDEFLDKIQLEHKAQLYGIILEALEEIIHFEKSDLESDKLFRFLNTNLPDYWEKPSIDLSWSFFKKHNIDENTKFEGFVKITMLLALHIRNAMEEFHIAYLNDSQMKILNPLIRQGLFEGLVIFAQKNVYSLMTVQKGLGLFNKTDDLIWDILSSYKIVG